jgi:hypothetical protein
MNLEKLVDRVLSELGLTYLDTLSKNSRILCVDAIYALILEETMKDAASLLEVSENSLEQTLRRHFKTYCNKDSNTKWSIFLLSLVQYKKCTKCNNILPFSEFSTNLSTSTSKSTICKVCDSKKAKIYREHNTEICINRSKLHYLDNKSDYLARNASRRALKIKATPSWADLLAIKEVYRSCPTNYHVDHIIPLRGDLVCGLHVENNLQHLPAVENLRKTNKFTGE